MVNTTEMDYQSLFPFQFTHLENVDWKAFYIAAMTLIRFQKYLFVCTGVNAAIAVIGIVANILNVTTFWRMRLKDNVTLILYNISLADLAFLSVFVMREIDGLLNRLIPDETFHAIFRLDKLAFSYVMRIFELCTLASSFFTTLLALQRCLCVLYPLKFKTMFTRRRTLIVIWTIWGYNGLLVLSRASLIRTRVFTSASNITYYDFWGIMTGNLYERFVFAQDVVNYVAINLLCQLVLVACIFIMLNALRKAVRFRQKSSSNSTPTAAITRKLGPNECELEARKEGGDGVLVSKGNTAMNSKDKKVISQVTLLSIIFILSHMHYTFFATYRTLVPYSESALGNMIPSYVYQDIIKPFLYVTNATVNIFVYLKYNIKFRQVFLRRKQDTKLKD